MTTLLEAAKTLIKVLELEKSQIVLSMTSGRALEQLEQAIAQEQKHTKFDVMVITTAYEQGFGKGLQDRGVPNVYVQDSPAFHAWNLGYEEGQMRLKEQKPEQPKDVAQIIGDLDAKMHKSFTSQTASTNPVVSQKAAGTVDKDCGNCKKFSTNSLTGGPVCISCKDYSNWEPKP